MFKSEWVSEWLISDWLKLVRVFMSIEWRWRWSNKSTYHANNVEIGHASVYLVMVCRRVIVHHLQNLSVIGLPKYRRLYREYYLQFFDIQNFRKRVENREKLFTKTFRFSLVACKKLPLKNLPLNSRSRLVGITALFRFTRTHKSIIKNMVIFITTLCTRSGSSKRLANL